MNFKKKLSLIGFFRSCAPLIAISLLTNGCAPREFNTAETSSTKKDGAPGPSSSKVRGQDDKIEPVPITQLGDTFADPIRLLPTDTVNCVDEKNYGVGEPEYKIKITFSDKSANLELNGESYPAECSATRFLSCKFQRRRLLMRTEHEVSFPLTASKVDSKKAMIAAVARLCFNTKDEMCNGRGLVCWVSAKE